jgi:hypothetical protein
MAIIPPTAATKFVIAVISVAVYVTVASVYPTFMRTLSLTSFESVQFGTTKITAFI